MKKNRLLPLDFVNDTQEFFEESDRLLMEFYMNETKWMIRKMASDYKHFGADYADLVNAGYLGMVRAFNHFDSEKGAKFSTYAWYWVFAEMMNEVSKSRLIHIPKGKEQDFLKIKPFLEMDDKYDKIKELFDFKKEYVDELEAIMTPMLSLDYVNASGDDMLEIIESDYSSVGEKTKQMVLQELIKPHLTDRQYQVVLLRLGFITGDVMTFNEIGKLLNTSHQYVANVFNRAIEKLKGNSKVVEEVRFLNEIWK